MEPHDPSKAVLVVDQAEVPSLCARCQQGRLVGQAIHERNLGWRYLLVCTDCNAAEELHGRSARQLAQPPTKTTTGNSGNHHAPSSKVPLAGEAVDPHPQRRNEDRKCSYPGCATILSAYNKTMKCWVHTAPSFR